MDLLVAPSSRCSPAWALSRATWKREGVKPSICTPGRLLIVRSAALASQLCVPSAFTGLCSEKHNLCLPPMTDETRNVERILQRPGRWNVLSKPGHLLFTLLLNSCVSIFGQGAVPWPHQDIGHTACACLRPDFQECWLVPGVLKLWVPSFYKHSSCRELLGPFRKSHSLGFNYQ